MAQSPRAGPPRSPGAACCQTTYLIGLCGRIARNETTRQSRIRLQSSVMYHCDYLDFATSSNPRWVTKGLGHACVTSPMSPDMCIQLWWPIVTASLYIYNWWQKGAGWGQSKPIGSKLHHAIKMTQFTSFRKTRQWFDLGPHGWKCQTSS